MSDSFKVHFLFESASRHVASEQAFETDQATLCELARRMQCDHDVIYCYPAWADGDRVVFWGIDGRRVTVELQKASEAMSLTREYEVERLDELILDLSAVFAAPEQHGFAKEPF